MPQGGVWFDLIEGCLDESACNYDPDAHIPNLDDPCIYPNECGNCNGQMDCVGCMDATAFNYDDTATIPCEDNAGNINYCCEPVVVGCMDENWISFDPNANTSDPSMCNGELKLFTCKECPVLSYYCGNLSYGYTNNWPYAYCDAHESDGTNPGSCAGWNGDYCNSGNGPGVLRQYWQPGIRRGGFRCSDQLGEEDCCSQGKYGTLWHQDWNYKDDLVNLCSNYPGGLDDQCGSDFLDIIALDFNGDYCEYAAGGWNEFAQWLTTMYGVPDIPCEQDNDQCTSPCLNANGYWKTHPLVRDVYDPLCGGPSTLGQGTTSHALPMSEWEEWVTSYNGLKNT